MSSDERKREGSTSTQIALPRKAPFRPQRAKVGCGILHHLDRLKERHPSRGISNSGEPCFCGITHSEYDGAGDPLGGGTFKHRLEEVNDERGREVHGVSTGTGIDVNGVAWHANR